MIIGQGVDIVEIKRIKNAIERGGAPFVKRVFTGSETEQAESRNAAKYSYYAGRWAAKEALSKALGCGIGEHCSFTDIEVLSDDYGVPRMSLNNNAKMQCDKLGGAHIHVSISHEAEYAVAFVTVEK